MSKITYPNLGGLGNYGNLGGLGNQGNLGGFNQATTSQLGSATKAQTGGPYKKQYSLAEVQLTNGEMVGMMITSTPALGQHLTAQMASDGYLNLFNESEALIIKADRVVAIKLTLMTTE
jgi:hypothetical protein